MNEEKLERLVAAAEEVADAAQLVGRLANLIYWILGIAVIVPIFLFLASMFSP